VSPAAARVVRVTVPAAEAELAADALFQAGAAAVEEVAGPGGVLLVASAVGRRGPAALVAAVAGRWPVEEAAVDLDAALDAWRPHARAVEAGPRLRVRPPWVPGAADGRVEVVVDPGRAFGSGAHASTRLALAALDGLVVGGERVLDVGSGSGVLALAALALGAVEAVAVDIDPAARAATVANAARNGVAAARLAVGEAIPVTGDRDLVMANMLLPDLIAVAPAVAGAAAPGGRVVVSGLLAGQRAAAVAAYGAQDLAPAAPDLAADGWVALTLARQDAAVSTARTAATGMGP
jgi:ribosomal protein L11 methyltransferase